MVQLSLTLADIFMCSFENRCLKNYSNDFKLSLIVQNYLRSVFGMYNPFSLFVQKGCSLVLDITIFYENEKFIINVYGKKIYSGVYANFKSFLSETYKIGSIKTLFFRCFSLSSNSDESHLGVDTYQTKFQSKNHRNYNNQKNVYNSSTTSE